MNTAILKKYSLAALLTAALLAGCGNSGVKPANGLADTPPAQSTQTSGEITEITASGTAETGTSATAGGTVTIDLGNASEGSPATISDPEDLSFLTEFIYDTGSKKEYTVTETITTKASSFDQMEE